MTTTRRISILNFKGGVGKSSTTGNLGHALTLMGRRVLVIDACRQWNVSSTLLSKEQVHPTLTQVLRGEVTLEQAIYQSPNRRNLYILPADDNLEKASSDLQGRRTAILGKWIEAIEKNFDYILFDHAGTYTPVMEAGLLASNEMLVPCELEPYAVQGLFKMFDKLGEILVDHEIHNSGIIPYNVDRRYTMQREYLKEMRETFGALVTTVIRTDATVSRSQSVQQTVFEYNPDSKAAEDFMTLAEDLIAEEVTEKQEAVR
jgi:chromosome partitioning protein